MDTLAKKISITLPTSIFNALMNEAKSKDRAVLYHIQRIVEDHALGKGFMSKFAVRERANFWRLVDEAVAKAIIIRDKDGLTSDITAKTFKACEKDNAWIALYESFVGGPPKAKGNSRKGLINREIGFQIRARLDAKVQKVNGKSVNIKVSDSIIQSYSAFVELV